MSFLKFLRARACRFDFAVPLSNNINSMATFCTSGLLHSPSLLTSEADWSATAFDVCFPLHILIAFISPAQSLRLQWSCDFDQRAPPDESAGHVREVSYSAQSAYLDRNSLPDATIYHFVPQGT